MPIVKYYCGICHALCGEGAKGLRAAKLCEKRGRPKYRFSVGQELAKPNGMRMTVLALSARLVKSGKPPYHKKHIPSYKLMFANELVVTRSEKWLTDLGYKPNTEDAQ